MQLAIIGAGNVGQALASAFIRRGQAVIIGVPEPSRYAASIAALGPLARLTTTADAIAAAEVIILAVPYAATASIAHSLSDWQGRILVDATNPLAAGLAGLAVSGNTSGAEELAKLAQGARVVKAFNTTGAENMADSHYKAGPLVMPVAGDDAQARSTVMSLATLIGFAAVDMGELYTARYLEPFAMTWIHLAIKRGYGRNVGMALLKR